MNLQELINFFNNGGNVNQIIQQMANANPMINNLLQSSKNNPQAIENFVKNICQERGINFDKEYNEFKEKLKNTKIF